MAEILAKGGNLLLESEAPGIEQVRVGIGWQAGPGAAAVEIDGLVSIVDEGAASGRLLLAHQVPNPEESVGSHPVSGPVVGDAERLVVTLAKVPSSVSRLQFGATIYDANGRRQTFRSVRGAYIRVLNHANGIEIARYTLDVETGSETAMVFGELYRHSRGWKFRAVGQGYAAGLRGIAGGAGDPPVARAVEVTDYVRRISPARSRRSFAEHLDPARAVPAPQRQQPSQPAQTRPAQPQPQPQPQPAPAQPRPARSQPAPPAPRPAQPQPKPPAAQPPSPPRVQPSRPAEPAASRSLLDLSDDEPAPPASSSRTSHPAPSSRPSSRPPTSSEPSSPPASSSASAHTGAVVEYGEHSSRHRQRTEHVAVLDDQHPATTWTEADRGAGGMTITLTWEPLQTSSGLPRPSDLHLAAFWQSNERSTGLMQTLGGAISAPGAAGPRQVLRLGRRDEREGQTIFVDTATLPSFKRFFVFAFGQHGSPEWAALRPVLTVAAPSGEQLTMQLGDAPPSARLCVVASFHVVQGDLIVRRENDFVTGLHPDAAQRYGFDFDWNSDGMTLRAGPPARSRR